MKLNEARKAYNDAEKFVEEHCNYGNFTNFTDFLRKAKAINERLVKMHGENVADDILGLIFENECS